MSPEYYANKIQNAITQYANDGVGLYNELKSIHAEAKGYGDEVLYPSERTLRITIPSSHQSIKISHKTNFNNCTFIVTNNVAKMDLFCLDPDSTPQSVTIEKSLLRKDAIVYGSNHELTSSPKLIIIEDQTPWASRVGASSPTKRRDVLFVTGNVVQNDPISSYDNNQSSPTCEYVDVSTAQKYFKKINFHRTTSSTYVTNLLSVNKQYNVLIKNVTITTPDQGEPGPNPAVTPIHEDECINIHNSAKIEMRDIEINYTYSTIYFYGYGIRLFNVWDSYIFHLTAHNPRKGVMGNDNVNGLIVENSDLNRVDVHCYGRDITCTNCLFRNSSNTYHIYNRVSSFFGQLTFINCTFNSFLPLRIDSDYNAFTPFDLILDNCTLNVNTDHESLVNTETLNHQISARPELAEKCLPNIIIRNLHLNIPSTETDFYIIRIYNYDYTGSIHYMNTFLVDIIELTAPSSINIHDFGYTVLNHPEYNNTPLNLVESLSWNLNMVRRTVGGSMIFL